MEMNIKLDLTIGEGESKKDISLTYDEAKALYEKLGELFNKSVSIDWHDWVKKLEGYKKVQDQDREWSKIIWKCPSISK